MITSILSRKKTIVQNVLTFLAKYSSRLTLRQIHYLLVGAANADASLEYVNTLNDYKRLSSILVDARDEGLVDPDLFEDKGRTFRSAEKIWSTSAGTFKAKDKQIDYDELSIIRGLAQNIFWAGSVDLDRMLYQDEVALVMLEKRTLENVFLSVIGSSAYFCVCGGYNSYTQLHELAKKLKLEKRGICLYVFSDFDPSGMDIARNFQAQLEQMREKGPDGKMISMGIRFKRVKRMGLTEEQVKLYKLPYAPVKDKDSRASGWVGGVVELDALDPKLLEQLVRDSIADCYNQEVRAAVQHQERVFNRIAHRVSNRRLDILFSKYPQHAEKLKREFYHT